MLKENCLKNEFSKISKVRSPSRCVQGPIYSPLCDMLVLGNVGTLCVPLRNNRTTETVMFPCID